jgi:hypothetical protein
MIYHRPNKGRLAPICSGQEFITKRTPAICQHQYGQLIRHPATPRTVRTDNRRYETEFADSLSSVGKQIERGGCIGVEADAAERMKWSSMSREIQRSPRG